MRRQRQLIHVSETGTVIQRSIFLNKYFSCSSSVRLVCQLCCVCAFTLEVALEKTSRQEQHTYIYPEIREQRECDDTLCPPKSPSSELSVSLSLILEAMIFLLQHAETQKRVY